jgi:hypothetical protein
MHDRVSAAILMSPGGRLPEGLSTVPRRLIVNGHLLDFASAGVLGYIFVILQDPSVNVPHALTLLGFSGVRNAARIERAYEHVAKRFVALASENRHGNRHMTRINADGDPDANEAVDGIRDDGLLVLLSALLRLLWVFGGVNVAAAAFVENGEIGCGGHACACAERRDGLFFALFPMAATVVTQKKHKKTKHLAFP